MKFDPKKIKKRYDEIAAEEDRQEKSSSLRTEIPREFIKRYIKKTDVVLDAGGGTGINAIMMAKKSKHVTLVDISPGILRLATENVEHAGLSHKIDICEGDISDLRQFGDGQFSFVVCVGDAISYVLDRRSKAMKELVRVARANSIIVVGCDSMYGFMGLSLREGDLAKATRIKKTHETHCGMGPRTHVFTVDEMKRLLMRSGCEVMEIASTPTITDTVDRAHFHDPRKWARLKKLELEICTRPELLGIGNHLLFIAKKK